MKIEWAAMDVAQKAAELGIVSGFTPREHFATVVYLVFQAASSSSSLGVQENERANRTRHMLIKAN